MVRRGGREGLPRRADEFFTPLGGWPGNMAQRCAPPHAAPPPRRCPGRRWMRSAPGWGTAHPPSGRAGWGGSGRDVRGGGRGSGRVCARAYACVCACACGLWLQWWRVLAAMEAGCGAVQGVTVHRLHALDVLLRAGCPARCVHCDAAEAAPTCRAAHSVALWQWPPGPQRCPADYYLESLPTVPP